MKKISSWAAHHIWSARILIISFSLILTFLGLATGILLRSLDIVLPDLLYIGLVLLLIACFLFYPSSEKRKTISGRRKLYWRQKSCDFTFAAITFTMMMTIANQPENFYNYNSTNATSIINTSFFPRDSVQHSYKSMPDFIASMKDANGKPLKWKERKKLLKVQINALKAADDLTDGQKAGYIVLAVLAAILLFFGVAALACSASCGGSEGLAAVIMIAGTALIVFLLVMVILKILGKWKGKKKFLNGDKGTN
jgi:hypothetical protein